MSNLLDLSNLMNQTTQFTEIATRIGFSSTGEIDRFVRKSYRAAIRAMSAASRPRGVVFVLEPAQHDGTIADADKLKSFLSLCRSKSKRIIYRIKLDMAVDAEVERELTLNESNTLGAGIWQKTQASTLSRANDKCVIWASGVNLAVFLDGHCYMDLTDVVEEIAGGAQSDFQKLSWADGEIAFEFAEQDLCDTGPTGVWRIPKKYILRPKPETIMSKRFGNFLRFRLAGYMSHEDEPYVDNQGRADITLNLYHGRSYIVEVKWIGLSLKSTKEKELDAVVETRLVTTSTRWFTRFDDSAFSSGSNQLAQYFGTTKYQRAFLIVFDCRAASTKATNETVAVKSVDVQPHDPENFRLLRACVDPRTASVSSKAKK